MPEETIDKFKMYVWYGDLGWNDKFRIILPGTSSTDAIDRYKKELSRLEWAKHETVKWIEQHPPDEEEDFEGWFYVENQRDG
jgi:hypothetical protein